MDVDMTLYDMFFLSGVKNYVLSFLNPLFHECLQISFL